MDQICPKWIKLDQIGFPHQSKNVSIKSCHIYKKIKNYHYIFGFFWIRWMDGSNSQIRWTDISNSRIQARRAWFLVEYKVINKKGLFYAKYFDFEEFSIPPVFCSSIQPQHTVRGVKNPGKIADVFCGWSLVWGSYRVISNARYWPPMNHVL